MQALLGTKVGMTQLIDDDGNVIPITVIQAGPNTVIQIKTKATDGYDAVQVAYGTKKNINKSLSGKIKDLDIKPKYIKEFRVDSLPESIKVGSQITVTTFSVGDIVDASGVSKGKGFAGNVKRNNYNTTRHTHGGQGDVRKPGSIGSMYPQRVFKGKTMPGRMGGENVTVKNLKVFYIDEKNNLIGLRGAVPGPRRGLVVIGGRK